MTRSNKEVITEHAVMAAAVCRRIIYILYIMTVSLSYVPLCIKNIAPVRVVIVGDWSYYVHRGLTEA